MYYPGMAFYPGKVVSDGSLREKNLQGNYISQILFLPPFVLEKLRLFDTVTATKAELDPPLCLLWFWMDL